MKKPFTNHKQTMMRAGETMTTPQPDDDEAERDDDDHQPDDDAKNRILCKALKPWNMGKPGG
jgi:hypothetical protein